MFAGKVVGSMVDIKFFEMTITIINGSTTLRMIRPIFSPKIGTKKVRCDNKYIVELC